MSKYKKDWNEFNDPPTIIDKFRYIAYFIKYHWNRFKIFYIQKGKEYVTFEWYLKERKR